MNEEKKISLAERIRELDMSDGYPHVESLETLSRRIPFFFQGVAALTGMRCHRENLDCWSRWEMMDEERCRKKSGNGQPIRKKDFLVWLVWGGIDLTEADDEEFFTNLLLEPMYWLEKCAKAQKYETQKGNL